jgi:hypothetical protein
VEILGIIHVLILMHLRLWDGSMTNEQLLLAYLAINTGLLSLFFLILNNNFNKRIDDLKEFFDHRFTQIEKRLEELEKARSN